MEKVSEITIEIITKETTTINVSSSDWYFDIEVLKVAINLLLRKRNAMVNRVINAISVKLTKLKSFIWKNRDVCDELFTAKFINHPINWKYEMSPVIPIKKSHFVEKEYFEKLMYLYIQ